MMTEQDRRAVFDWSRSAPEKGRTDPLDGHNAAKTFQNQAICPAHGICPLLVNINFIIPHQRAGVKSNGISTLAKRVLIVYTQFMKFRQDGVY